MNGKATKEVNLLTVQVSGPTIAVLPIHKVSFTFTIYKVSNLEWRVSVSCTSDQDLSRRFRPTATDICQNQHSRRTLMKEGPLLQWSRSCWSYLRLSCQSPQLLKKFAQCSSPIWLSTPGLHLAVNVMVLANASAFFVAIYSEVDDKTKPMRMYMWQRREQHVKTWPVETCIVHTFHRPEPHLWIPRVSECTPRNDSSD